jgi:ATP-dependent Clp protease protease subunit
MDAIQNQPGSEQNQGGSRFAQWLEPQAPDLTGAEFQADLRPADLSPGTPTSLNNNAEEAGAKTENFVIPTVTTADGRQSLDILSGLLKHRTIMLHDAIEGPRTAGLINSQMLWLSHEAPSKDINIYLNSPGGSVTDGLAIYDTMKLVKNDVAITVMGQAASMGAVLACGGTEGKRFALPNARLMIHSVRGGTQGIAQDIINQGDELKRLNERLMEIISENTGQPMEQVRKDFASDKFMDAYESVHYGLIDAVIQPDGSLYKKDGIEKDGVLTPHADGAQ